MPPKKRIFVNEKMFDDLYAQGYNYTQIGEKMGVSGQMISRYAREIKKLPRAAKTPGIDKSKVIPSYLHLSHYFG